MSKFHKTLLVATVVASTGVAGFVPSAFAEDSVKTEVTKPATNTSDKGPLTYDKEGVSKGFHTKLTAITKSLDKSFLAKENASKYVDTYTKLFDNGIKEIKDGASAAEINKVVEGVDKEVAKTTKDLVKDASKAFTDKYATNNTNMTSVQYKSFVMQLDELNKAVEKDTRYVNFDQHLDKLTKIYDAVDVASKGDYTANFKKTLEDLKVKVTNSKGADKEKVLAEIDKLAKEFEKEGTNHNVNTYNDKLTALEKSVDTLLASAPAADTKDKDAKAKDAKAEGKKDLPLTGSQTALVATGIGAALIAIAGFFGLRRRKQ